MSNFSGTYKNQSLHWNFSSNSPETKRGSKNNQPMTLPFSLGSSQIKPFVFSEHSSPAITAERINDLEAWCQHYFAAYTAAANAPRHDRFWQWIEDLQPGIRPRPRVEVWPRGGGKSTTIELGCARLGSEPSPRRHYVLYVCKTQAQADKHVTAIAAMLERCNVGRAVNEYGSSKGWRHSEIRTSTGFNVTAFGLDSGMRGVKLDQYRPDVMIFDDVDDRLDTSDTTQKKIDVITTTILPSGSSDCAIIFVQNKIAQNSIVSRLCDGRADFLHDRLPATVEPAVIGLRYARVTQDDGTARYVITEGVASWEGQSLVTCEQQINAWGLGAFRREAQHNVEIVEGALWKRDFIVQKPAVDLQRIVVAVDPAGTSNRSSDETGIIVAGLGVDGCGYILADRSCRLSPDGWARRAVAAFHEFSADRLVAEVNYGGDMVALTIATVDRTVPFKKVTASRGKAVRAEPVAAIYEQRRAFHCAPFPELEDQLCSWTPESGESPDRLDALVWALSELMVTAEKSRQLVTW